MEYLAFPGVICLYKRQCHPISARYYLVDEFRLDSLGRVTVKGFDLVYDAGGHQYHQFYAQTYYLDVITRAAFIRKFGRA